MPTDNAPPLSGTITVYNNTATFTIIPIVDTLTEGLEYITMGVTTATSDQVLASATVTVGDTGTPTVTNTSTSFVTATNAPVPTYSLTANKTSMNEGDTVTFTLTTTNVANGSILYWGSDLGLTPYLNTAAGEDFGYVNSFPASNALIVNSNYAQFNLTAVNDMLTEGMETLAITVRSSSNGPLVARASLITVNDTSTPTSSSTVTNTPTTTNTPVPTNTPTTTNSSRTYTLTANRGSMNEGDTITYLISSTNVPNGTVVYWASDFGLSPTYNTVVGNDFGYPSDLPISGTALVTAVTINNNTASFSLTAANDLTTENIETLAMTIRSSVPDGPLLARAPLVTINDTSKAPTSSSTTPNTAPTNIGWPTANGTVGNVVDAQFASLFSDAQNNIVSYTATGLPPGLTINTVTGRVTGTTTQVGTFPSTVTAYDSGNLTSTMAGNWNISLAPTSASATYQIIPKINGVYSNTVNEGASITFEITTTNVPNGTVIYWGSDTGLTPSYNTTTGSDFGLSDSLTGSALAAATAVTINNNIGTFTLTATNDMVTENTEILSIIIKATSAVITNAGVLARADMVFVFDTSTTPTVSSATYSLNPDLLSLLSLGQVTYTIATTNVPNGTQIYWQSDNGLNPSYNDQHGFNPTGEQVETGGLITINNNAATFIISPTPAIYYGSGQNIGTLAMTLRASANGTLLTRAPVVSVTQYYEQP